MIYVGTIIYAAPLHPYRVFAELLYVQIYYNINRTAVFSRRPFIVDFLCINLLFYFPGFINKMAAASFFFPRQILMLPLMEAAASERLHPWLSSALTIVV